MAEEWKYRTVRLRRWAWEALAQLAQRENRTQLEQARHLIEDGLRRQGFEEKKETDK